MNTDFARQQMIRQQIRAWDVLDHNVLDGMNDVPRERFVPTGFEKLAFAETQIPIGHGQNMMTPTIEGRVLQALGLAGGELVLEIGTGSGYITACLATLASHVTSIDIYDDFLESAGSALESCGIDNVTLQRMDATQLLPDGTFDAIAVTGSIQNLDTRFVEALNPGGRLFVVTGDAPAMTAQRILKTDDGEWHTESLFETDLPPLINGALPPQFAF